MMKKCCAFLTGIAIGAVVTALITPKTGKELQEDLIKKANEMQKKIKDFDIKDLSFNETKEALKQKIEDAKKMIDEFNWEDSKEKVQKKFDEMSERLMEIKEQLTEAKEEITEEAQEIIDVAT